MLNEYFPVVIANALDNLSKNKLNEIRLRINRPIIVDYGGLYYLSKNGVTDIISNAIICNKEMVDYIVTQACENSIYAYNEDIKQGFLTISGGVRIGLAGTCVKDGSNIKTLKNISSLNIRIPHEIKNCSLKILEFITEPLIHNTLILSSPGAGKTTLLRDLAFQISQRYLQNILIVDERNEIANTINGISQYNLGIFCDVMTNCTKKFGLENGIRSMRPDVVMTDEVANEDDVKAIHYALGCGVKVIATTHCDSINVLKNKKYFNEIIDKQTFERYVHLSTRNGAGTLEGVYDKNFKCLCM